MSKEKRYRFFFHYNKPLSKQRGETMWSVHFRNTCYFTREIACGVPVQSKTNKRQPYAVIQGFARFVNEDGEDLVVIS